MKPTGKKVFYGWWIAAAGSALYALGSGAVFYGFNVFFNPMINEFGWSRAVASGAFSMSRLEGGLEGPLAGWLIDKYGARKLAFIGGLITGAGFIALLLVNNNPLSLYLIFGLLSMGYNVGFQHAATAAAAKWFIARRSLVLSIITAGAGIGGAVMVPGLAWLTVQYGWRAAAVITGLVIWVLGQPIALLLRSTPEEMGLAPDGKALAQPPGAIDEPRLGELETQSPAADASAGETDFTVREALKTRAFWTYTAAMMLRACILSSLVIHQIPYIVNMGIDYQTGATILGLMILISLPGRLLFGWLGDIYDKRLIMFVTTLLQSIGIWVFINATTIGILYVFVVVFGLGYGGAIPLSFSLRADLFGRRTFATISGIVTSLTTITTVASPVLIGYLYDVSQSYIMGFYILLVVTALSGVLFLLIRQPKPPVRLTGAPVGS